MVAFSRRSCLLMTALLAAAEGFHRPLLHPVLLGAVVLGTLVKNIVFWP